MPDTADSTRPHTDAVERLLDQREAQGLPRHVTDRAAITAVATVLRPTTTTKEVA